MIPLRDTIPSRKTPVVTFGLIGLNAAVFLFELTMGPRDLQRFMVQLGVVPARFYGEFGPSEAITLLTSLFLHGGWFHLIGNMWSLWIFGDNVEDRLGHVRYLLFYLAAGVAAGLTHLALSAQSPVPTVGASGAIAGVMGAYLILFPTARVITLIPIVFFIEIIEVPAVWFLVIWFFMQFLNGLSSITANVNVYAGGVAWWAHVGGFVAGLLVARRVRDAGPMPQKEASNARR